MVPKEYNPLEAIDASMEQKEHKKEKKLRDRETGGQQEEKIKELKLLKKINYKLLEIKGEILSLTGKIKSKLKRKKGIKTKLQPGYRNLKGKIVGTLEALDELLEEDED